jgi:HEAT repeat protein
VKRGLKPEQGEGTRGRRALIHASIWVRTVVVLVAYTVAICAVHVELMGSVVTMPALSIVLAFTIVQAFAIVSILVGLVLVKAVVAARERFIRRWIPIARDRMVAHLMGAEAWPELKDLAARAPTAVERCAEDLLASISGTELERMSELAHELGLVDRWRRRVGRGGVDARRRAIAILGRLSGPGGNGALHGALEDPEEAVRLEAARALLRSDGLDDLERIFEFATLETPFLRAILVEDLRPHALTLSEQAIPRVLAGGRPDQIRVTLEMIEAWQKTLPVPGVATLLRHPRPELRAQALRVLPYVAADVDIVRETRIALEDESPEVRIAATRVAGRLGMEDTILELRRQLRHADRHVAVAAAYALAEVGGEGWNVLQSTVRTEDSTAAMAALEALERVRTNRLHLARV